MSERLIFKIAVLSHDEPLYEKLHSVFGIDFESSYTETSGSAFAYSHFDVEEDQRLTAQFWMLDASPQWSSIRNLYLRGASGIILLHDPSVKNATEMNKRLLREFVGVNRFSVPMIVFNISKNKNKIETDKFAKDISRWTGYNIPSLKLDTDKDKIDSILATFMKNVRDWRTKNVIFQTLKLYFSIDSINNTKRPISTIIRQLRRIYISHYYELLNDEEIYDIIQQATIMEGFELNSEEKSIYYEKRLQDNPWELIQNRIKKDSFDKPKIEKIE